MVQKLGKSALCAAFLIAAPNFAYANHVDFMDDAGFAIQATNGQTATAVVNPMGGDALGGQRNVTLIHQNSSGGVFAALNPTNPGTNDDSVFFTSDSEAEGSLLFEYGLAGDLNLDFTQIWNAVSLDFGSGSNDAVVTVSVTSSTYGSSSLTQAYGGGEGSVAFRFADFGALQFTDVDQISVLIDGVANGNYNIQSFTRQTLAPVPVPAALPLFLSGLAGLGFMRRKSA